MEIINKNCGYPQKIRVTPKYQRFKNNLARIFLKEMEMHYFKRERYYWKDSMGDLHHLPDMEDRYIQNICNRCSSMSGCWTPQQERKVKNIMTLEKEYRRFKELGYIV